MSHPPATDYVIDDTMVGQTIGPPDALLVNLSMLTPPVYEVPQFDEGRQCWVSAHLVLQGSGDVRPLISINPNLNTANTLVDGALPYTGGLTVVAVPRNSTLRDSAAPERRGDDHCLLTQRFNLRFAFGVGVGFVTRQFGQQRQCVLTTGILNQFH